MVAQIEKAMFRKRPWKIPGRLYAWALVEGRPLTTSGRWINRFVFGLCHLRQIIPGCRGARRPIYIIGTGRSGTTVLGTLFAMHRQTVFLNEPKALWYDACGFEDIIGSYTDQEATIRLNPRAARSNMGRRLARNYSGAMRAGLAGRVVDKYPELVFRVDFVRALFPDARFVAILRDGVDTCSSVTGWSQRKGRQVKGETHDWWGRNGRKWRLIVDELLPEHRDLAHLGDVLRDAPDHRDRAAVEWILSMREARAAAARHEAVMSIKYEDLCAAPTEVLERLQDHCGLRRDPVFADYAAEVLSAADAYEPLELLPELIPAFVGELNAMGYGDSASRVRARGADAR